MRSVVIGVLCAVASVFGGEFKTEVLVEGMERPMEVEVAADGRVFFIELGGIV
ncbi:MAG: hypothetical protein P8J87_09950 [Verrucomicrobiales bacterium]|nr:hypothetical protein [Verrucomicrobiales bacterium]